MNTKKLIAYLMVTMVSVLFLTDSGFGQPYRHWSNTFEPGNDRSTTPYAFTTDKKSNTIVAGTVTVNSIQNTVSLVYKLDSNGVMCWEYRDIALSSSARSVSTDSLGNVYVAGIEYLPVSNYAYTMKFDMHGNLIWTRYYSYVQNEYAVKVLSDNAGYVYTVINSEVPGGKMRIVVLKYDSMGNNIFETIISESAYNGIKARDALLDTNSNVIIGGGIVSSGLLRNLLICKISTSGTIVWKKFIENPEPNADFSGMALDGSGSVIITGSFQSGPEFRSATYKYSSNGDSLWSYIPNIDVLGMFSPVSDVCIDRSDNVIVSVGKTESNSQLLTFKLSPGGLLLWSRDFYNGNPNTINLISSVSCDKYENIYVVGYMDVYWQNIPYQHLLKYDAAGNSVWDMRVQSNGVLFPGSGGTDIKGDLILMSYEYPTDQINISKYSDSLLPVLELDLSVLIQGRYDRISNQMIQDTGMVILHEANGQFTAIDTARLLINSNGQANCTFTKTPIYRNYYIEIRHRNSIPVWSSVPLMMLFGVSNNYSFIENPGSSFGSNMISVDDNPVRYALYTGDVNRDGFIDATDCSVIDNDAQNYATGYILSDLTGDGLTDADDLAIVSSNAALFIESVRP